MRPVVLSTVLLVGCGLSGRQAWAQEGPVGLLPAKKPAVLVPAPALGALVTTAPPSRPAAPAPGSSPTAPAHKIPEALYVLDQRVVVGNYFLRTLNPADIKDIQVYKGPGAPALFRELTQNGIISIVLKKRARLPSESLAQLGHQLRVQQNVSYLLNGLPVTNKKLRIATESIQEIKVVRSATGSTLSVWLFQQASPSQSAGPVTPHPPGTIMIRGTASR